MNRRPPILKLSKAISDFLQYKAAEGLSPRTLECYEQHLKNLLTYAGDIDVNQMQPPQLRDYLAWLRTDYKPKRFNGQAHPISPKTLRNVWVSLSAFFRWASNKMGMPNPMKAIPAPRFEEAPVEPFTREEIEALLYRLAARLMPTHFRLTGVPTIHNPPLRCIDMPSAHLRVDMILSIGRRRPLRQQ